MKRLVPYMLMLTLILLCLGINKRAIRSINPDNTERSSTSITEGGAIWSIDNQWYNQSFKNWKEHGSFTTDPRYPELRVRRTPLYPVFIGLPVWYLGTVAGTAVIFFLQLLLHLFAAYLLSQTVFLLTRSEKLEKIGLYAYGLCPFIFIYCNYTVTESLSPFFATAILFCFVKYINSEKEVKWLILTGVTIGLATLHRPLLIFYALPIGLYVFFRHGINLKRLRGRLLHCLLLAGSFLVVLTPWVARNYSITHEIILTEKWYYEDPMDFGRGHTFFRKWVSSFSNPANELSTEVFAGRVRSIQDTSEISTLIENYMSKIPAWVFDINDKVAVRNQIRNYVACLRDRDARVASAPATSLKELGERPCEFEIREAFDRLTAQIRAGAPLRYYLIIPGKTLLRDGMFHSFSSPWAILNGQYLNKWMLIGIKALFFLLNVVLWMSVFVRVFRTGNVQTRRIDITLIGIVTVFVIFHVFVFRYCEARYFLTFYPILILFTVAAFNLKAKMQPGFKSAGTGKRKTLGVNN